MTTFREIFRFEIRHHLRSTTFWLAGAVFFLLAFGAVTTDMITVGGAVGNVNRNAPYVIAQFLLIFSVLGVFVTTVFVASAVLRDYQHRTDGIFYSKPVTKRDYLLGRFGGAFTVSVLIFLSVAFAVVVGSFMPWLEAERVGPFQLMPYVYAMGVLVLPNVLLMSAIFFGLATLTRSMVATYAGLVAFFVGYGIAGTLLADVEDEAMAALVDPFGVAAFQIATQYWTTAERNTLVLGLEGGILQNRLLWLAVALLILMVTFWRFSFTAGAARRPLGRAKRKAAVDVGDALDRPAPTGPRGLEGFGRGSRQFGLAASWIQLAHQSRLEVKGVVRSLPFLVILALGMLNFIGSATSTGTIFGTAVHPRTQLMVQVVLSSFLLFGVIILTFYSGELVWRDRASGTDEVHDALPVRSWVLWGSKMVALAVVSVAVLAVAVLTAVGYQLWQGHTDLETLLYLQAVGLRVGIPVLLVAVLALFTQVLTNNKYLGFLLMVLYYISIPVMTALDLNHRLYQYSQTPPLPYSDMNGYGHFVEPMVWFFAYWGFAALGLLVLVHLLWVRGKETAPGVRLRLAAQRFTGPTRAAAAVAVLGFLGTGSWIFYNTNVLNDYVPPDRVQDRLADYEKEYSRYEGAPQPRITAVHAEVDIYPRERAVDIRGTYTVRNKEAVALDSVHLTWNPQVVDSLELGVPGGTILHEDAEMGWRTYGLAEPMPPGGELELTYRVEVRNPGFVNSGSNTNVVHNGTFFNNASYFPHIGYNDAFELGDPVERRRRDLAPIERMPSLYDSTHYDTNYLTGESDWVDFETVVSTSADQIALAPGYLEREWEEAGRRYFHYTMDAPILGFWSYLSARWEVRRDRWRDVDLAVYYHPDHAYNVDRMIEAAKKSLDYFTREFGPYQHRQLRILEFPGYASFAQSFPNTIPFSETIGFIARLDDPKDIDYVFYVTAHEVAHQWWAHQVMGANVQGATVTSETMSQYSALMVQEKEYGPEMMRRFLRYELDAYLQGRGGEVIEELPLFLVENQGYIHYRKGSLVTYAMRDYMGEEAFNRAMSRYVEAVRFSGPPYTTSQEYLDYLVAEVPERWTGKVEDLYRTITLWELEADAATWEPTDDGRYRVRLEVRARKQRADGQGNTTEAPLDEWVDIGVFGAETPDTPEEGKVLFLEKRHLADTVAVIEVVVDEEPVRAGVDPFNKLIDRNPGNNVREVERGGG
jgi:ABC-type transport system involved in multi-copper enzyme maturation permease subunit